PDQLDLVGADLVGIRVPGKNALLVGDSDRRAGPAQRRHEADGEIGGKTCADSLQQGRNPDGDTPNHARPPQTVLDVHCDYFNFTASATAGKRIRMRAPALKSTLASHARRSPLRAWEPDVRIWYQSYVD